MNSHGRIRILIADDHSMFRDGLRAMIQTNDDFTLVGEAADGSEAVNLVRNTDADILLLDLSMPVMDGFQVLRELARFPHTVRTILLTAAADKSQIIHALQLGARGVVWKASTAETLFKSVRCVMDSQVWVSRECVNELVTVLRTTTEMDNVASGDILKRKYETSSAAGLKGHDEQAGNESRTTKFGLTNRELEIINAIVDGQSNRDIAATYQISQYTVKHHLTRIFDKVGVYSRLELAMFAIHHQLNTPHQNA